MGVGLGGRCGLGSSQQQSNSAMVSVRAALAGLPARLRVQQTSREQLFLTRLARPQPTASAFFCLATRSEQMCILYAT